MAGPSYSRQIARQFGHAFDKLFRRNATIDAGGQGRRWPHGGMRDPSREVQARTALAAARAAAFAMNSPYGAAMRHAWCSSLVGDGPSLRPTTKDKNLAAAVQSAWSEFWDECDSEGLADLAGVLQRVASGLLLDGEAFIHMLADRETGALRLALLAADQVDRSLNREIAPGHRIVAGIEFIGGRRVAYHVRENLDVAFAVSYETRRVPADDMLHLFDPIFPGQVRGLSPMAPSATRLSDADKLEDALLAKANTAALFGGVFYRPDDGNTPLAPGVNPAGDFNLEPGAMVFAPPGYSVEFTDPPSTDGAIDFLRSQIRAIATGVGIPYELVSGDLSQVNYSSARLGLMEFRRRMTTMQKTMIVARFLNPVWRRFLILEGLAGRMELGVAMTLKAEFVFPGWAPIDPLKETNADLAAIKGGIKSRFEVISARGRDPDVVDDEIALDPPVQAQTERVPA